MSKQEIKIQDIDKIGMELFRKNNTNYITSELSDVMERIFTAANISDGIEECTNEHYMKSGIVPGRIYYIYSDQLYENNRYKNYDVVVLNDEECVWLYSKNIINNIDEHPGNTIFQLYNVLINTFKQYRNKSSCCYFINTENTILKFVMSIKLMAFLNNEYGIIDVDKFKSELMTRMIISTFTFGRYDEKAMMAFIDNVIDKCSEPDYFIKRKYLDSYKLIFTTKSL